MSKRRKETPRRKRRAFSKTQLATSSAIFAAAIIVVSTILFFQQQPHDDHFSLKAAIVDQLSGEFPDPEFVADVNTSLMEYGFSVNYTDKPTVEFFKGLARNNYGIIVLRVHSALRNDSSTVDFFTSEPFNTQDHVQERDEGLVVKGILNYSGTVKEYFAITPGFVAKLEGKFPKSIVLAMGCWSLKHGLEQMANAFTGKGAKAYFGWSNLVEPSNVSNETAKLIRRLLVEGKTLEEAASETPHDHEFIYSTLGYYPEPAGSLRLSDLISEAKNIGSSPNPAILNYSSNLALTAVYSNHKKSRGFK